jgi:hypothetical protein
MQLSIHSKSCVTASRQAVRGRQAPLVVPHAVKDVFMPALRCVGLLGARASLGRRSIAWL